MEQIIANLISNAIKFGAGSPIDVCLRQEPDLAVFEVLDRGVGIAPADHERVFGHFEQLRSPGDRPHGAGLGLWLVRELVQAHGGEIALVSAPGTGATFTVRLPVEPIAGKVSHD